MSNWLEEAIKTMPSQNAGGAPTATPEQLFEFHDTVTRYRIRKISCQYRYNTIDYYIYIYTYIYISFYLFRYTGQRRQRLLHMLYGILHVCIADAF